MTDARTTAYPAVIPSSSHVVLTSPLDKAGILAALKDEHWVTGIITVDLSDFIDNDLEGVLDLLSERLVGSVCGMEIDYKPIGVDKDGALLVEVTLDVSAVLDDLEADDD